MGKRLSLRGRIVLTALLASGLALSTLLWLAAPRLDARARHDAAATLLAEAKLMARVVEDSLARGTSPAALDPIVDEAAREVNARVTVIATDGRLLADSALSGSALLQAENHAARPEVKAALAGAASSIERHSATVGTELLYAAVPVRAEGRVVGVARLSRGLDSVTQASHALWWSAALALGLALVATGLLSLALSASLGRALQQMIGAARRLAGGDLAARIEVRRDDELGELARVINQSAELLQQRIGEIARDRARTDAVLVALDDGVLAVDHRGSVVLANERLSRALELAAPIGRHYLEVIRQREIALLIEEVLRGAERRTIEVELLHVGRVYAITGVPFPGAEGAPPGVVLTFNDATERHRVERLRRDFVANASHELRTPLTSIRGFVEALEDGAVAQPEKAQRFLGKIRTHADRMAALVEDLLELSRLETGDRPPEWEKVEPRDLVADVVTAFSGSAARKQISLQHVDRGAPAVVSDPERLRRVLENLIDNALKYTPSGGHVEITTRAAQGAGAEIEVADDGPGIAGEHQDRIFERFYRVDKARSRELGGTGLGLSIVKHLAEGMGASLSVHSEVGRGSRFSVRIPERPPAGWTAEPTVR